jgi:hypothetical protein
VEVPVRLVDDDRGPSTRESRPDDADVEIRVYQLLLGGSSDGPQCHEEPAQPREAPHLPSLKRASAAAASRFGSPFDQSTGPCSKRRLRPASV